MRLLLVFIVTSSSGLLSQTVNVPLDHWAYRFLDRLETKGLYISQDFDTRPYSREAVAEIILQVYRKLQNQPDILTPVETGLYEQLKGEFVEELQRIEREIPIAESEYEPHLFIWRDEGIRVHGDVLASQQFKEETKESVDATIPRSITSFGMTGRVRLRESLAVYIEGRTFILSDIDSLANTTFSPSLGLPVTQDAFVGVTVTDNTSAYAVLRLPWFDLQAGRDLAEWGPGFRGSLVLSRNSNFYDLFKLTFRYRKFKFEHIHAFLNADHSKYLAGHRLEIRPFRNFQFAINETVVYGGRNVEFLYLNPFVPILIAERHLGNQDNNKVSLDATLFIPRQRVKIYLEVLFDDFSLADNIFTDFVNKWGVMIGGYWVDPLGIRDLDLRFELIRIQPFVYSHTDPINTYSNYNNILGHWLGPDADDWYFELGKQMHKNLRVSVSWEQRRRANNDITDGERPSDDKIHFLDGILERNRYYGFA
ncbi:capsule assembly Wzi family protein, partial [bacterium]|nr:capsule assembly Wzi family protein [bacterium]